MGLCVGKPVGAKGQIVSMRNILEFIVRFCPFLCADAKYRNVDSEVSNVFGGDVYLTIESEVLRMRFTRDRAQLFLDVQGARAEAGKKWFSIDLVKRLLTGERQRTAEFDKSYAIFLRNSIQEIELRFSGTDRYRETTTKLRAIERQRSRELFGRG